MKTEFNPHNLYVMAGHGSVTLIPVPGLRTAESLGSMAGFFQMASSKLVGPGGQVLKVTREV